MDPHFLESIHSDIDSSFRCLRFSCERFSDDHAWHYHPEYELTGSSAAKDRVSSEIAFSRYGANDLVLVGPQPAALLA